MEAPTDLQSHLAERILAHARMSQLPAGHHLTELSLQHIFAPRVVQSGSALAYLERFGAVEKRPNKGYYLTGLDVDLGSVAPRSDEALYRAIADDRLSGSLGEVVSEMELARRYELSRHRLARILDRIAAEGWIEKRRGHGWGFQPLINSPAAYRESYELRLILEPAALRLPGFKVNREALEDLRRQQLFILDEGYRTLSRIDMFESNARFHEMLATMSGNRFVTQTIIRLNQLRRLVEYRSRSELDRIRRVCEEHLEMLARLSADEVLFAATLLEKHLADARDEKTRLEDFVQL